MSKKDLDKLEIAAKVAGYNYVRVKDFECLLVNGISWSPYVNEHQAFRLMCDCKMGVVFTPDGVVAIAYDSARGDEHVELCNPEDNMELYRATRRAIVECAVKMGRKDEL